MTRRESPAMPIGVFDSGVGGLTVARAIIARMPRERLIYIADQAHVPYGGRRLEEVAGFAAALTDYLFASGAKAVVMACNISSATALDALRRRYKETRVLGMIDPGARAAVALARRETIGVLATQGTVATRAYTREIARLDPQLSALEVACPDFVPLVEAGDFDGPRAVASAKAALAPILEAGADTVILGCTHYPFLLPALRIAAPNVRFVDPAIALAEELERVLEGDDLLARERPPTSAPSRFLTTGDPELFRLQLAGVFPDQAAAARTVTWSMIKTAPAEAAP